MIYTQTHRPNTLPINIYSALDNINDKLKSIHLNAPKFLKRLTTEYLTNKIINTISIYNNDLKIIIDKLNSQIKASELEHSKREKLIELSNYTDHLTTLLHKENYLNNKEIEMLSDELLTRHLALEHIIYYHSPVTKNEFEHDKEYKEYANLVTKHIKY